MELFRTFKKRWASDLFSHEVDIPEHFIEEKICPGFLKFSARVWRNSCSQKPPQADAPSVVTGTPGWNRSRSRSKTFEGAIEEAKVDPDIPRSVVELIEKNKMNAAGQSGASTRKLIETLLAIPWGKIKRIWVSPGEFEDGLNRSHYGLKKPKEDHSATFSPTDLAVPALQGIGKRNRGKGREALCSSSALPAWGKPRWRYRSPATWAFPTTSCRWRG